MGLTAAFWIMAVVVVIAALGVVFLRNVFRAALALVLLSAGFMGYLNSALGMASRLALVAAGVMILLPDFWTTIVGVMMGVFIWFASRGMGRKGGEISGDEAQRVH